MARRRKGTAAWAMAGLVLVLTPLAVAQDADLRITDMTVQTLDGEPLANPGLNEPVEVVVEVTNTGQAQDSDEPIEVILEVEGPSGFTETFDTRVVPNRTAGGTTEVVFEWRPMETGDHLLTARLPNGAVGQLEDVRVTQTPKAAGTLADRFVEFWYVSAAFAASVVLFAVVGAVRGKP